MIGSLRGRVAAEYPEGEMVIDVGGVGYRVTVNAGAMVGVGEEIFVHVHTHVREDSLVLFGFLHDDERRCFESLLTVHGVGPSLAMGILAVFSPATLAAAVLEEDLDALCAVPGVGRKGAARLVLDLKAKLSLPDLQRDPASASSRTARGEARAALVELGYSAEEIRSALDVAPADAGVEEILRQALRSLVTR